LKSYPTKFVKKLDEIPKVSLPPSSSRKKFGYGRPWLDQSVYRYLAIPKNGGNLDGKEIGNP
jgi:hypothetical protein